MTNLFHLTAGEVAAIYKARWQIELFFKWVKQHLKIKSFLGTTANAVMTRVWVALYVYLLVAYVKFLLRPPGRLYEIFKRLQVTALEYRALGQVLAWEAKKGPKQERCCMDRGGDGIRPFPSGSVRRCVRTQAARVRSLCSELSGRPGSP